MMFERFQEGINKTRRPEGVAPPRTEKVLILHIRSERFLEILVNFRKPKRGAIGTQKPFVVGENIKHRGEAVLRKHLRTFEENQISNIIRKTKGKRRLKFHNFTAPKNTRRDTRKPRKPFFPN